MPSIARTKASLRVVSDSLEPEVVTRTLGRTPTWQVRRGEPNPRAPGARAPTGVWSLESGVADGESLEAHPTALLGKLPDPSAIRSLPSDCDAEVFVGLFMEGVNEGFSLSGSALRELGEVGPGLGFDLCGPLDGPPSEEGP